MDELSKTAFELLLKEPFYAHVLAGMPRQASESVTTLGLTWDGRQVCLQVNPDFFLNQLSRKHRPGVLKLEILHVVFRHLFRQSDKNPKLYSIAADLVVTQFSNPWPLPDTYPTLSDFPELALPPLATAEEYYRILERLLEEMLEAGFDPDSDEQPCGSGSGQHCCFSGSSSAKRLAELLRNATSRSNDEGWVEESGKACDVGRYIVGNLLLRCRDRLGPHQFGNLPSSLISELQAIAPERLPRLDWRKTVRIFCASSGRTRIKHSLKRISKRFGTRPGIKIKRLKRLLVAIDTSGSIDDVLLDQFFHEVHAAWRLGTTVTIVECDAEVKRSYEYQGYRPTVVSGGGGTLFEPVFLWMQTQKPFDGMVYFTDGFGLRPRTSPNCKLLWVVPEKRCSPLPFGSTVEMWS